MTSSDSNPTQDYYPELYNRPPRLQDELIEGSISIPAPPNPQEGEQGRNFFMMLLPMAAPLLTGVFYLLISSSTGRNPLYTIPMIVMAVLSVVIALLTYSQQRWAQRQKELLALRNYHDLLDRRMARLQAARDLQIVQQLAAHPHPDRLAEMVARVKIGVWARRANDPDFAHLRVGIGDVPSLIGVEGPDPDLDAPEIRRALRLVYKYRTVEGGVQRVSLYDHGSVGLVGKREDVRRLAYAMLAQLVVHHAPSDISLYIISSESGEQQWGWAHWLPHTSREALGGFPDCIAYDPKDAASLISLISARFEGLEDEQRGSAKRVMVVFDQPNRWLGDSTFHKVIAGHLHGVAALCLCEDIRDVPPDCGVVIEVDSRADTHIGFIGKQGVKLKGKADALSLVKLDTMARQLSGLRLPSLSDVNRIPTSIGFLSMYGQNTIEDIGLAARWNRIPKEGVLPFPAPMGGVDQSNLLYLDLSDQAHGPHGMIAGTTGAGKSELLRTVVMSLAIENHPYYLNFLLIDFKGGSTFRAFETLPHTVGTLSNIDGDDPKQARTEALRLLNAIKSENQARQRFLKNISHKTGKNITDITAYHHLLETEYDGVIPDNWTPMPHLIIIIDEFAELANDLPDFLPEMVSVVRVGRSLGMHLVLAMQRPGNHVKDEMRANLQFRISLRVQSPDDSRDILGRSEAAYLPNGVRGRAYFKSGQSGLIQFQAAQISMNYVPPSADPADIEPPSYKFTIYKGGKPKEYRLEDKTKTREKARKLPTLLSVLVAHSIEVFDQLGGRRPPPILLPSLPASLLLGRVFEDYLVRHPSLSERRWDGVGWDTRSEPVGMLRVPIGLIDDVAGRQSRPLVVNFDEDGSVVIAGSAQTGKSTALRTILVSLVQCYPPDEVECYVVGRRLGRLTLLPHVVSVIESGEKERMGRLLDHLEHIISERERIYREKGVADFQSYLTTLHKQNPRVIPAHPAIVVFIDNMSEVIADSEKAAWMNLITNGRTVGIYFVVTGAAVASNDLGSILDLTEQRITFALPEKSDIAQVVGAMDERGFEARPGGGLIRTKGRPLPIQISQPFFAVPDENETPEDDEFSRMCRDMVIAVEKHHIVRQGQPIEILGGRVPFFEPDVRTDQLRIRRRDARPILRDMLKMDWSDGFKVGVGLDFRTVKLTVIDVTEDSPHLLIGGGAETGRTGVLRVLALGAASIHPPEELRIILADINSAPLRLKGLPHVAEADRWYTIEAFKAGVLQLHEEVYQKRKAEFEAAEQAGKPAPVFQRIFILIDNYETILENLPERAPLPKTSSSASAASGASAPATPTAEKPVPSSATTPSATSTVIPVGERVLFSQKLAEMVAMGKDLGIHIFITFDTATPAALFTNEMLLKKLKGLRTAVALGSHEAITQVIPNTTPPRVETKEQLPAGRGFLISRKAMRLTQFAHIDNEEQVIRYITERLNPPIQS